VVEKITKNCILQIDIMIHLRRFLTKIDSYITISMRNSRNPTKLPQSEGLVWIEGAITMLHEQGKTHKPRQQDSNSPVIRLLKQQLIKEKDIHI